MKRALWLALAAAVAAGCGGGDDDGKGSSDRPTEPPAAELMRFESPRIAFTFDYPEDLVVEKRPDEGVLARVGVKPGSRLNAIKVRRTAPRELQTKRYLDEFRRDFERTVGTVTKREERIGELDAGVLEFEDSVTRGDKTVDFKSSSYFFKGGGQTWQVECIADVEHRQEIEDACDIALRSVEFSR